MVFQSTDNDKRDRDLILSRVVTNARALGLYMDVHVSNVREII